MFRDFCAPVATDKGHSLPTLVGIREDRDQFRASPAPWPGMNLRDYLCGDGLKQLSETALYVIRS